MHNFVVSTSSLLLRKEQVVSCDRKVVMYSVQLSTRNSENEIEEVSK